MASRTRPLGPLAGIVAMGLAGLVLGPVGLVALRAEHWGLDPADWAAVRFTVLQAALSAGVSCALAVPAARALARRQFAGRAALIRLMGAPFLLPGVVAVLALLAVFGRAGPVNQGLGLLGLPPVSLFGLQGVVLAHVFLNLPLAIRLLLGGWQAIPAERFRLAQALGFGPMAVARHLEVPMLRAVLPGAVLVIFLICLSSFAVALSLGGGPGATTVELAIYQALLFDFDLGGAAMLALVQVALCAAAVALAVRVTVPAGSGTGLDRASDRIAPGGWRRGADGVVIGLAAGFLLLPLLAVGVNGMPGLADLPWSIGAAALRSAGVGVVAATLAVTGALALALAAARGSRLAEAAAMLPMAVSGLVLGTGLLLGLQPVVQLEVVALPVTALVNAALALPFAFRVILPEAQAVARDYGRLQAALGLRGWAGLRVVVLPRLRRPLGFAAGLAAALSVGDLGVIALFAGDGAATLPLMVQRLLGAYRVEQAAAAALVLVALGFGMFWLCDRWGRHAAA